MSARKTFPSLLTQLAHMNGRELHTRFLQEFAKRWDAASYLLGIQPRREVPERSIERRGHFFFTPSEIPQITALLRARLPQQTARILEYADQVCLHRFHLLGYDNLDYGKEIDWHFDAVSGKRAPRKLWYRLRFLDFDQVGDAKVIWELSRHQHLVTLAKAYRLTGEERFAAELISEWYHWQRENPYPIGVNWASSLEVAFRSISWLWVRHLLADCPVVPLRFFSDLTRALDLNGWHIERYLSTYFSPNTHLLGEGVGLFFVGTLCPQLPSARCWQQKGWEIVLREARRQVRPDGMHFEQSTYYHVYALDFFLHARMLAAANKLPIPSEFDNSILKMLDALRVLAQAGTVPRQGDDDGGRLFDPRRNRTEHLLDPLSTGAVLFGCGSFKGVAGGLCEEALWLLGSEAASQFDRLEGTPPALASTGLESSGLYVLASAESSPQEMVIQVGSPDAGPVGHRHADALSVQLVINGREWLSDSGTYVYVGPNGERELFRETAAHNALQVDSISQSQPVAPFQWHGFPQSQVRQWATGRTFDLFLGYHDGYRRLPDSVRHHRFVFHLKSHFWLVRDLAMGQEEHQLDVFWHAGPGIRCERVRDATLFRAADGGALALLPMAGHGWAEEVISGWYSPTYGERIQSSTLRFTRKIRLPAAFATLLVPLPALKDDPGEFLQLDDTATNAWIHGYRYSVDNRTHLVFFGDGMRPWRHGGWSSDAQFLYCGSTSDGQLLHMILLNGSYAQHAGNRGLEFQHAVEQCEWCVGPQGAKLYCSGDAAPLTVPAGRAEYVEPVVAAVKLNSDCGGAR